MIFGKHRAAGAAFALAAGIALAQTAWLPAAQADRGRIVTVQAGAELQKRAELLTKGLVDAGGKVSWAAIEAGASPESLVLKQVEITAPDGKKYALEELNVRAFDWNNAQQPLHADIALKNLVIGAETMDKEAADNLKELELDKLTVNAEIAYKIDEGEKAFDIARLNFDFADLGELRLRLKLTGITPADLKAATGEKPEGDKPAPQGQDAAMNLLSRLNIAGAAISFKDKGLLGRLFKADAKKKNIGETEAKTKLIDELTEEHAKAEDEVTKELIDAAIKFLRNPGEIEFVSAPAAPANVMAAFMTIMGNRTSFKQLLGLTVAVR